MERIITKLWLVSAFEYWITLIFTEEVWKGKRAESILLICRVQIVIQPRD